MIHGDPCNSMCGLVHVGHFGSSESGLRGDDTASGARHEGYKHLNLQPRSTWFHSPKTTPKSCPTFFENDDRRLAREELHHTLVRYMAVIVVPATLTFCRKETTCNRRYEGAPRHRKGIIRLVSSSQSVFGGHQRTC